MNHNEELEFIFKTTSRYYSNIADKEKSTGTMNKR